MFKIFRQTRRTIPREVRKIVHPASLVATVVSHGSETCPNMGDDGPQPLVSCLKTDLQMAVCWRSVPNGWKFPYG
jgi:hypothetical protein